MDVDTLKRVRALSDEAAAVVRWAVHLEGTLHRIEEACMSIMRNPKDLDAEKYVPRKSGQSWVSAMHDFAKEERSHKHR